jgi:chorismate lyase/3-hydroxybenzoate synthase
MPLSAQRLALPASVVTVDGAALGHPLGAFRFGGVAEGVAVPLAQLDGPVEPERWRAQVDGDFRLETVRVADAADIEEAAEQAYRRLLADVRGSAQPYLLRIWNYFPGINDGDGDGERYRRFCVGRARAVDPQFHDPPPAATAIGSLGAGDGLHVVALCARQPGVALENPRQTPAWRYPREYGPVSPGFSRGALLGSGSSAVLLASGTASIVGHVSRHPGDFGGQLEESLANLAALLDEGSARSGQFFALARCAALRVYLRRADDLEAARSAIRRRLGDGLRVRYLLGDICRRELDVELEGVFPAA